MDKKRKTVLGILLASILTLGLVGSLAFYTASIDQNNKFKTSLETGTMSLIFEDGDEGIEAEMQFGQPVTKKFRIINNGSLEASLSLDWKNLVNTYLYRSLSYNLSYSNEENGTYIEVIPETNMPVSETPIRQAIASELSVPANTTYYYNLTITLNYLEDVEQSDDLDAIFNTEFDVGDPSRYRHYRLTIRTNGGAFEDGTIQKEHLLKNNETLSIGDVPTRTGYTFMGWKLQGLASTLVEDTFTMGISDTYLDAKWSLTPYTLTIDANGGTYEGETTRDITYLNSVDITTPTREGHTFTGWEITGGRIENGKFILTEAKNASIKATWDANTYKYIVYHNKKNLSEGYTLAEAVTGTAEYGKEVTLERKNYVGFNIPEVKKLTIKVENKKENGEDVYPPEVNKSDYNYERKQYDLVIDPNGGTYNGTTSQTTKKLYYEETLQLSESTSVQETLDALGVTTKTGSPDFGSAAITDETADGLYSMEDDYGTSYYYRGAVENNYVKFGGFYWRIIRINGDGSVRMIYDGTVAHKNGEGNETFTETSKDGTRSSEDRFIKVDQPWNSINDDAKYVGWMYGGLKGEASISKEQAQKNETDSDIKIVVDNWYKTNIYDKGLDKYVGDEIFCNDRSTPPNGTKWSNNQAEYSKLGFGKNLTPYGTWSRFILPTGDFANLNPKFTCDQTNDMFTVNKNALGNKTTNGNLTYPVGLITSDEIVTAGSGKTKNRYFYLYKSSIYFNWSISPYFYYGNPYYASIAGVQYYGDFSWTSAAFLAAVDPVINIAPEYAKTMTGTGSATDPYQIPESASIIEKPTKEGYTFSGWTKTSGNGTLDGSVFAMKDDSMSYDSTIITANYAPREYQITFNANGGTVDNLSKVVTYNAEYGELPTPSYPTVTGYEFLGWFTEKDGGTKITSDTTFIETSNQILYAHWKPSTFSVPEAVTAILNKQTPKGVKTTTPNFGKVPTTNEGVFAMADDYGTSYYYRGAVTNNYVKFGKWAEGTTLADGTNASGKDMWWRIIRINGDGSVRMIYDGTQAWPNGNGEATFTTSGSNRFVSIGKQWNSNHNDAKYGGYMYGGSNGTASSKKDGTDSTAATYNETDSDIKTVVDTWYLKNLASTYGKYIADAIYCNDRSTPANGVTWSNNQAEYTKLGFAQNTTPYGVFSRVESQSGTYKTPSPKLSCDQANDMFTVNKNIVGNKTTNGDLTYPVGLVTADEAVVAGAIPGVAGKHYYLYKSSDYWYWTLSPNEMLGAPDSKVMAFYIYASGHLGSDTVRARGAVAPVISISANYAKTMTGTGSALDPYVIPGVE